jgi:D-lactate dehydrogenase
MNVAVFSTKPYDRAYLLQADPQERHALKFFEPRLSLETAPLAEGSDAVCAFVNDDLSAPVLRRLREGGTRFVALRSAGFNHVDLVAARDLEIVVARVPAYSPHAVAEHAVGLILTLNRKFHRAFNRVREGNFALDGLLGFDLRGRTVGIIGTGKIGAVFARILHGFECHLLAHDPNPAPECLALGVEYVELETLLRESHIISLHCPLTPGTRHLIGREAIETVRPGVMIINTSRGALVDTRAVIAGLKSGRIGSLGLDVYEEEEDLFFEDLSGQVLQDDVFARLLTFPNVLITSHQGFFTDDALRNIADATIGNLTAFGGGGGTLHEITVDRIA